MRKIRCYCSTDVYGSKVEETIEVEDDATEEEIKQEFQEWLNSNTDMGWYEVRVDD